MAPISDDLKIRNTNSAAWHLYDTERAARGLLEAEVTALKKQLGAKQARIDALMIEYCPDEVTDEQSEIEQLRTENDALSEQVSQLQTIITEEAKESSEVIIERDALKEQVAHLQILERQLAEKDAELKTERIRLAACGVVALANTPDSAAKAREMLPEYRSASCDAVARTVDREMALREQLATVTAQRDLLKDALEKLFSWVDAYAETSDTEFPTVERLCVEALASLKGE